MDTTSAWGTSLNHVTLLRTSKICQEYSLHSTLLFLILCFLQWSRLHMLKSYPPPRGGHFLAREIYCLSFSFFPQVIYTRVYTCLTSTRSSLYRTGFININIKLHLTSTHLLFSSNGSFLGVGGRLSLPKLAPIPLNTIQAVNFIPRSTLC